MNNVFLVNFDKLMLSPEKSISIIANKTKCKYTGSLANHLNNKPKH